MEFKMTSTTMTLESFKTEQGVRFRRNSEEIKNGLSREDAFAARLANGNVRGPSAIPRSVWEHPNLNIENFSEIVFEETGIKGKRFRMTREQHKAVKNGTMTRTDAFEIKRQKELNNA
jgi:hypothetical protein